VGGPPGRLIITTAQRQQVFDYCLDHRPNEACGLLAGRGDRVERIYPARNQEQSPVRYQMDPKELITIFQDIDDADLRTVGIFHSHVFTEAYPSPTDVKWANWGDVLYVLISLTNERNPIIRAFTILKGPIPADGPIPAHGQISEVEVVVEP
jgi:[CysO sulfur-carrier protein]-S-L-cysteine hydrolase